MNLRYGKADENVLKRSVADVILHERQKIQACDECKKDSGGGPFPNGSGRSGGLFSENPDRYSAESDVMSAKNPDRDFAISAVTFSEKMQADYR